MGIRINLINLGYRIYSKYSYHLLYTIHVFLFRKFILLPTNLYKIAGLGLHCLLRVFFPKAKSKYGSMIELTLSPALVGFDPNKLLSDRIYHYDDTLSGADLG